MSFATSPLLIPNDEASFSSNAHSPELSSAVGLAPTVALETHAAFEVPSRHPNLCFNDGSIAILCGHQYFLVHQSLLALHSPAFKQLMDTADDACHLIEGRPALRLPDTPQDMLIFLKALYGLYKPKDLEQFPVVSAVLRLATTYEAVAVRAEILRKLKVCWPASLAHWETRERSAINEAGVYSPCPPAVHPILIIALARDINAAELLPAAFYDLSRYLPSQLASGYTEPDSGITYYLSSEDLFRVFRGKEHAARYFSTFIVKELEGRTPSEWCHNRNEMQPARKRRCQVAFEAVTYALIRDVNGLVLNRNSDPLFAIADSFLMQTRDDAPGTENRAAVRACESCRMEYGAIVEAVREEFWRRLPEWFELDIPDWG